METLTYFSYTLFLDSIYNFNGNEYFGECFDYRLIRELFKDLLIEENNRKDIFKLITKKIGKTKFFIGIDKRVIEAINSKNIEFLNSNEFEQIYILEDNCSKFIDKDGILIIKSVNGKDKQLEDIFPEEEVKNRLGLYTNYIVGKAHRCNEPCRSKEKEGKPCEILTFRKFCHFHR